MIIGNWLVIVFMWALAFFASNTANAAAFIQLDIPNDAILKSWSCKDFIQLSAKDYSKITGKKMTIGEKISFMMMKKNMQQALKKNSNLTVSEYLAEHKKISIGWWIAGAIVVILILLIIVNPPVTIIYLQLVTHPFLVGCHLQPTCLQNYFCFLWWETRRGHS